MQPAAEHPNAGVLLPLAPPRALPRPRRGDPPRETSLRRHRTRSDIAPSHDSFLGGLLRPHLTLLRTHAQWGPTNHRELIGPARSSLTSSGVIAAHWRSRAHAA